MAEDTTTDDTGHVLRSMLRFSWSMSLFGARQTGALLAALGAARPADRVKETFDAVADAAEAELGEPLADYFRTGWRWQRRALDAALGVAAPAFEIGRGVASTTLLWSSLETGRRSVDLLDAALPERLALAWRELGNKLAAFEDFQYAHRILGLFEETDLADALGRADDHGAYRRLWLLEGLGFAFAESEWDDGAPPRGLFAGRRLDAVPASGWLPLHTGLGLSLARRRLHRLDARRGAEEVAAAVDDFVELCNANARGGYGQAIFESLGLVVRHLDPAAVTAVDRELARRSREHRALFWHGVGRGLYFLVSQTYPGSLPRALELARSEPPHALGRRNAVAGLAWAFTLVNFRHPEVLEAFLEHHAGGWSADDEEAFGHGVSSAFLFWYDATGSDGGDRLWRAFRDHRPAAANDERWRRLVAAPCGDARERFPELKRGERLGEIFRDLGPTGGS